MCGVKLRRILPPISCRSAFCVASFYGPPYCAKHRKQPVQFMILPKQVASIRLARKNLEQ
ncbi:hypothetical protein ApDm4_0640 [Acetobacter pomorum]|nr:hypothetical protein ApDm4_0640 [Acetobacter pomorum]